MSDTHDIVVIGIAGGSGSGKTTFTQHIKQRLGDDVTVVTHDSYYAEHHELTYDERTKLNYDHPDAYETSLLVEHLAALRHGQAVEVPVYDFADYDRSDKTVAVAPSRVIVVEGILIFTDAALRDLMDIKVYVDADADVRILRRLLRDVEERGRTVASVVDQYIATVKPMHEAYVEPSKRFADIIVPHGGDNAVALDVVVSSIQRRLTQV